MAIRGGRVAALFSIALGASSAHGQSLPPRIELRWQAPSECPDDLALPRAIEEFLGQPLAQAREQQLRIEARVHGDPAQGYAGKVSFTTDTGTTERQLDHPDCVKLTEGLALLSALAIDPERVRAREQVETTPQAPGAEPPPAPARAASAPSVGVAPTPPPVSTAVPASLRPRLSERQVQTRVGVLGLVSGGGLPSAAPGLGAELAVALGPFEAGLAARYWIARSAAIPGAPGSSVVLSLATAALRLCAVPKHSDWSLLACARGDLGDMSGRGEHVDDARGEHALFGGVGGSVAVAHTIGRFRPLVGADWLWLVARPRFRVSQEGRGAACTRLKLRAPFRWR